MQASQILVALMAIMFIATQAIMGQDSQRRAHFRVILYDALGRVTRVLHDDALDSGHHLMPIRGLQPGIYVLAVRNLHNTEYRKLVVTP